MKVVLAAVGSEGDVAPSVSVGRELAKRGHEVVIVALPQYARTVVEAGIALEPIASGAAPLWPDNALARQLALSQSGAMFASMLVSFERLAPHTVDALIRACRGADVLVSGTVTRGAAEMLSRRAGMRHVSVLYAPLLPSRDPAATCLGLPGPVPALTFGSSAVMWRLTTALGAAHARQMARRLGGRKTAGTAPITLMATSPVVSPPSDAWPANVEQVGRIRSTAGRPPLPEAVSEFLASGEPRVAMTFGSSPASREASDHRLFIDAARRAGVRLLVPGVEPAAGSTNGAVMFAGAMDFEELMPRLNAIVHHGGAGTTYTALAGGVPAVVVPHLGDQGYYARRVAELGAGVRSVPRWRLTTTRLARMLEAALDDTLRAGARSVAAALSRERDGAQRVADRIEALAATS